MTLIERLEAAEGGGRDSLVQDNLIDAWDVLRSACERVECSLPHQLSDNIVDLRAQWRAFDALIMAQAKGIRAIQPKEGEE